MSTATSEAAPEPCEWCSLPTEATTTGNPARLCARCQIVQAEDKRTWEEPQGSYAWLDRGLR